MKEDKEIEKILLNDESYDKFVNQKFEKEFALELDKAATVKNTVITDIKQVPQDKLFSKSAIYIVMNKNSKTKSYINGVQAEGFLGADNTLREKFLSAKTDSFVSGDTFVKFCKFKV